MSISAACGAMDSTTSCPNYFVPGRLLLTNTIGRVAATGRAIHPTDPDDAAHNAQPKPMPR
jgi:hypothetical protein